MALTPFIGYKPDSDPTTVGVIADVTMMVPALNGYRGAPSRVSLNYDALAAACQGSLLIVKLDGTTRLFAGTGTKLYEGSGTSWTDRTRAVGGDYSIASDLMWSFCQFGDTTIATNKTDALQQSSSGAFANVATSPTARLCETTNGFVMLADCSDGTAGTAFGDQSDRWWCSSYLDATSGTAWTPSVTTQCTTGRLVDIPGPIRALKRLGNNIIAYKDKGIFLGTYTGAPAVFSWQAIPGDFGAGSSQSVISVGSSHYFIGYEDIYAFDGSRPIPIGDGIKRYFFTQLNKQYRYRVQGLHDRVNSSVWFFYPNNSSSDGSCNAAIVFNYVTQQWGKADQNIESVVETLTGVVTYEGLGVLYSTYDDLPDIAYDSPFFTSSAPVIAVFGTDHIAYSLTGVSSASQLITGDYGDDDQYSTLCKARLRFVLKPTTATGTHLYRSVSGDSLTSGSASTMSDGKFDFLQSSRWHRIQFDFTGDVVTDGVWLDIKPDGTK